jgi:hypothetical protein
MKFAASQVTRMLDWFEAVGVATWNLAALVTQADGRQVIQGGDRARDRAEVLKCVPWAAALNARHGAAIYMRPARWTADGARASWPVVFFDDVPPDIVAQTRWRALVIQTSPGRHHVWVACDRPLAEHERRIVQSAMQSQMHSDPASTSGEHYGRAAGFRNHKRQAWVSIKATVGGDPLNVDGIIERASVSAPQAHSSPPQGVGGGGRVLHSSGGRGGGGRQSESEREFGHVIGRLRWQMDRDPSGVLREAEALTAALEAQAYARGKRDPTDYARRTVAAAMARLPGRLIR